MKVFLTSRLDVTGLPFYILVETSILRAKPNGANHLQAPHVNETDRHSLYLVLTQAVSR